MFTVCLYAASSEAVAPGYRKVAADLGEGIARRGWAMVYGGGGVGLMGDAARAAMAAGGEVTGVIPHRLAIREVALEDVSELIQVETMRERKQLMDDRSDAFVVLPGGIGTLEELMEILTLRQLGYHDRPIVLLDALGYWDPLLEQLQRMVDEGFSLPQILDLFTSVRDVDGALEALAAAAVGAAR